LSDTRRKQVDQGILRLQGAQEVQARRKTLGRVLGQGAGDDGAVFLRQGLQVRLRLRVLQQELTRVFALEGKRTRQQFLKGDGQAVLVAVLADLALEYLGRGIQRRDRAQVNIALPRDTVHQAKVGDLHMLAHQEKVARLDVQVLQVVPQIHHIAHFGGLTQITK